MTAPGELPAVRFYLALLAAHLLVGAQVQIAFPIAGLLWSEVFVFAAPTWILVRGSNLSPPAFLGLGPTPGRTLGLAAVVALVNYPVAGGLMAAMRALFPPEIVRRFDASEILGVDHPALRATLLAAVVVAAPLCEEVAFRGYLQRVLVARAGALRGVLVTASLFSLLHLDPVGLLPRLELGVVFGLLALWSGSLWPAVLAHAIHNGAAAATYYASGGVTEPEGGSVAEALLLVAAAGALLVPLLGRFRRRPTPAATREAPPIDPTRDFRFRPDAVRAPLTAAAALAIGALYGFSLAF